MATLTRLLVQRLARCTYLEVHAKRSFDCGHNGTSLSARLAILGESSTYRERPPGGSFGRVRIGPDAVAALIKEVILVVAAVEVHLDSAWLTGIPELSGR